MVILQRAALVERTVIDDGHIAHILKSGTRTAPAAGVKVLRNNIVRCTQQYRCHPLSSTHHHDDSHGIWHDGWPNFNAASPITDEVKTVPSRKSLILNTMRTEIVSPAVLSLPSVKRFPARYRGHARRNLLESSAR